MPSSTLERGWHRCLKPSTSRAQVEREPGEPAADARVGAQRACLEHDAAYEAGIDQPLRLDFAAGGLLDARDDVLRLLVGQLVRGRQRDVELPLGLSDDAIELGADAFDRPGSALLGDELQEVR